MEEKEPKVKIFLEAESREYVFTAPLNMKITYENISPSQLTIKDPNNVWETHLAVIYQGQSSDEAFGKIEMTHPGEETSRQIEPEAEMISIEPGGRYSFESDAAIRFYSLFHPGQFDLKIRDVSDDDLTMESNAISLTIRMTGESVSRLMAIVGDEMQAVEYRFWAADWLRKIKVDFSPRFASDEADDAIKESSRASIEEELGKFRSWWVTFGKSDAANKLLCEINEEYFKIPEDEDDSEAEEIEDDEL